MIYPNLWLPYMRVRRALTDYPLFDVPHKQREKELSMREAQENFDYFMNVRHMRALFFQEWLKQHFSIEAEQSSAGMSALDVWIRRFAGGLIGDELSVWIFAAYAKPWTGMFAGYNVIVDMGIFIGEYIISVLPQVCWEIYEGHNFEPASFDSFGFRRPTLGGFRQQYWRLDVITDSYGIILDRRKSSKIGRDTFLDQPQPVATLIQSIL